MIKKGGHWTGASAEEVAAQRTAVNQQYGLMAVVVVAATAALAAIAPQGRPDGKDESTNDEPALAKQEVPGKDEPRDVDSDLDEETRYLKQRIAELERNR